jgi:hypothetical protein
MLGHSLARAAVVIRSAPGILSGDSSSVNVCVIVCDAYSIPLSRSVSRL